MVFLGPGHVGSILLVLESFLEVRRIRHTSPGWKPAVLPVVDYTILARGREDIIVPAGFPDTVYE
jgi:hypothetical protein